MITVPGGKHNDPQPEDYRVAFDEFIAGLPPLGAAKRNADLEVTVEALPP